MKPRTVADVRRAVSRAIGNGSPTAALDARIIVAHLLGCVPEQLPLRDTEAAPEALATEALALAARRAAGEPVARIVGEKEFHGLTFALSADTLVPRPDTETLVDAAVEFANARDAAGTGVSILDLGTGSGAILVSLLSALPKATGLGIDIAPGAIETARVNAARHSVETRSRFAEGNWATGIRERFDIVAANPPYIETGVIAGLAVDVREHDPHLALDGGADGLDAIFSILADLDRVLADGGLGLIEVGAGQAATVKGLAEAHGFDCRFRRDLAGIDRVALMRRQSDFAEPVG